MIKNNKKRTIIKYEAVIIDGQIKALESEKVHERIKEFIAHNAGYGMDVTIESHSRPEYWQHKYLYGYVYPYISMAQSGHKFDINEIDQQLKEKYLFQAVSDRTEIPSRHRARCKEFYVDYRDDSGEIKRQIYGYLPSKATLKFEEYRDYILKCEFVRDGLEGWCIEDEDIKSMHKIRALAMKQD